MSLGLDVIRGGAVGVGFSSCVGGERSAAKTSAMPVSIGYSFSMANGLGFFRSIIAVAAVCSVLLPPAFVWKSATVLKYLGICGDSAEPTAVG